MANEQNLKPIKQSNEEATKNGRKGGIASGKARRDAKTFKEIAEKLLAMNVKVKQNGEEVEMSAKEAILIAQMKKAMKGDPKALEWLAKFSGEMPADKVAVEGDIHNTLEVKILNNGGESVPTADDET